MAIGSRIFTDAISRLSQDQGDALMDMIFLRPWWLLALVPIAYLLWQSWRTRDKDYDQWHSVIDPHLAPYVLEKMAPQPTWLKSVLLSITGGLVVLALSGPAIKHTVAQSELIAPLKVLVVDLSGEGENPQQAKHFSQQLRGKLLALLNGIPKGKVALIAYAGEPYLIVPPTLDVETINHFVPELLPEVIPVSGNRPDKALAMASALFERANSEQGQIIWFSNGSDGVAKVLSINFKIPLSILYGRAHPAPELTEIARRNQAQLIKMTLDNSDIQQLHHQVVASEQLIISTQDYSDQGYWLLLPLLAIVAILWRFQLVAIAIAPMLPSFLLAALLFTPQPAVAGENSDNLHGWLLMLLGNYQQAAATFSDPRWQAAAYYRQGDFVLADKLLAPFDDAESLYNRGNALAQMGKYLAALQCYERSLAHHFNQDTQYNRDLMKKLLNSPKDTPNNENRGKGEPPNHQSNNDSEAERVARQWLQGVPDEPAKLLKLKLKQEQQRRDAKQNQPQ